MHKQWRINDADPKLQAILSNALDIHPIIAQLLINRGITDIQQAKDFLAADITSLHDPFLLKNMDKPPPRSPKTKNKKKKIILFLG